MTIINWFKALAVGGLVLLGAVHIAKADTFNAIPVAPSGGNLGGAQFTANVYFFNNNPASNPFGLTASNCGPVAPAASTCNGNPFSAHGLTIGSFPGQTATIIFGNSSTPGFQLFGNQLDGALITGSTSIYTGTDAAPIMNVGDSRFYTAGAFWDNGACNGTAPGCNSSATPVKLTFVEDVSGLSVFTLTDTSFNYIFSIPNSTPEPSSVLMLGSGLLALLGLGLCRRVAPCQFVSSRLVTSVRRPFLP